VPPDLDVPALEISKNITPEKATEKFPSIRGRTLISSSDAHCLNDIGAGRTAFHLESRTAEEIALACEGLGGRRVGSNE